MDAREKRIPATPPCPPSSGLVDSLSAALFLIMHLAPCGTTRLTRYADLLATAQSDAAGRLSGWRAGLRAGDLPAPVPYAEHFQPHRRWAS